MEASVRDWEERMAHIVDKAKITGLGIFWFTLAGCSSVPDLWQGEQVFVDARHDTLEREFEKKAEEVDELREQFTVFERLLISLSAKVEEQERRLRQAQETGAVSGAEFNALQGDVKASKSRLEEIASAITGVEGRIYSIELAEANRASAPVQAQPIETLDADTEEDTPDTVADAADLSTIGSADAISGSLDAPDGGEPVTENGTETEPFEISDSSQSEYGIHLASFRSLEQISGAWRSLVSDFVELEQTAPVVFRQNQEGIGEFVRLIAGPYENEKLAELACQLIKDVSSEQYCQVAVYQGEPLGDG